MNETAVTIRKVAFRETLLRPIQNLLVCVILAVAALREAHGAAKCEGANFQAHQANDAARRACGKLDRTMAEATEQFKHCEAERAECAKFAAEGKHGEA